jgi:hypothetical protein
MIGSLRDRLRRRLARDVPPESSDERPLRERSGGDDADRVRNAQSRQEDAVAPPTTADGEPAQPLDVAASTLPSASLAAHVPDAVARFDPWGHRSSSSALDHVKAYLGP